MGERMLFAPQKNPLLIPIILQNVLEHLESLEDIKQFRLVCHEWKTAADPFVRKTAKIGLSFLFHPEDFIRKYSNHWKTLPFRDFKFYIDEPLYGKLLDFVKEWNDKEGIRSLQFESSTVLKGCKTRDLKLMYSISNCINLVAHNLQKVEISNYQYIVSLDVLSSIPHLILQKCNVAVDYMQHQLYPVTVVLHNVRFIEGRQRLSQVLLNEFIDFSRCSYINLDTLRSNTEYYFDLSADKINANKIIFNHIDLLKSGNIDVKVDYFTMSLDFERPVNIDVKELEFTKCSITLSKVPTSVQHLLLVEAKGIAKDNEPCALPNLNYLTIVFPNSRCGRSLNAMEKFQMLKHFRDCPQITAMQLEVLHFDAKKYEISLRWLPRGLQTLKFVRTRKFKLIPGPETIDVNVLILQYCTTACVSKMLERINPQTLVLSTVYNLSEFMNDLMVFLLTEPHIHKIVVACANPVKNEEVFKKSPFSKFVDYNSQFYEFENMAGKAISKKVFEKYAALF